MQTQPHTRAHNIFYRESFLLMYIKIYEGRSESKFRHLFRILQNFQRDQHLNLVSILIKHTLSQSLRDLSFIDNL